MTVRKRNDREVMAALVMGLNKRNDELIRALDALLALNFDKPGIASGLYDMRLTAGSSRVWLLGLLDSTRNN